MIENLFWTCLLFIGTSFLFIQLTPGSDFDELPAWLKFPSAVAAVVLMVSGAAACCIGFYILLLKIWAN